MITKAYNRIKQGVLWVKNNPKRAILTLLGISFVSAAPILFPGTTEQNKNDILPITFNGKTIEFPYTDDNTGETLIIKTDQQTYSSWDSAYVHFAVKNITNDDQSVKVQFAYDGGASTSQVEEFKPQVSYQVEVPVYETKTYECKEGWGELIEGLDTKYICKGDPKTARFCDSVDKTVCTVNEQTGSHFETRYKDEWGAIAKDVVEDLKSKDVKPIDVKFVPKEQVTYWIPAGATKYFRAKIVFNPKSNGEFYINAYGHLNAVGHLDPWYSSSWGYRRQITLDYTKVGATSTITGFPFMFSTSTITDLKFTGSGGKVGKSDGTDILITESDGTTKLPHEIEFYSSSTGETVLWFKSSTSTPVSTTSPSTYYIYYGNSGASDQQDKTNVWDSNYRFVYHLGDGDSTSANFYQDSTSNNIDATLWDGNLNSTQDTGKMGYGYNFAGDADYMALSDATDPTAYTVSAWVKYSTTSPINIFTRTDSSGPVTTWSHQMSIDSDAKPVNYAYDQTAAASRCVQSPNATSQNTWYYITTTALNSSGMGLYVDGVLKGTTPLNTLWTGGDRYRIAQNTAVLESSPGVGCPSATAPGYFGGVIDELRLSLAVRSSSWIATEYNNQSSPNTFWSVGSEEQDTPAAAPSSRRIIIIE